MQTVLPVWVLQLMSKYSSRRNLKHARHTAQLANAVTRQLVDSKAEALLQGKGNKDILSLLGGFVASFLSLDTPNPVTFFPCLVLMLKVQANASENTNTKLSDEELLAQMRCVLKTPQ